VKNVEEMEMSILRCVAFLCLIQLFAYAQAPQERHRADSSNQAELPVRGLYQQLVSRPIGGIPTIERMKSLSPYLSDSLLNRIAQARACGDDWFRLHPRNDIKAPLAWLEFGLFSGADDRSGPHTFQIEKAESQEDGSIRVNVRLTEGIPPEKPWTWEVAAVVIREDGRFVINDVVFLKDKDVNTESRLSEILQRGCDGSRWVGYGNETAKP
jgi:hypothetical protein